MKRILFYITAAALLWLFVSYVDIIAGGYSGWNMLRLMFAATV